MAKKRTIELAIAGYTFSLNNLKVHDDMSEETTCFTADLVCNGKVIAHCKNDGHGEMTDVCCYRSDKNYQLYLTSMETISTVRDTEYEKEMDERLKKFKWYNGKPCVQCFTEDHLAERLMYKQAAWDDAVRQIKRFAKKFPDSSIWFNGESMCASSPSREHEMIVKGFENVTEWVR